MFLVLQRFARVAHRFGVKKGISLEALEIMEMLEMLEIHGILKILRILAGPEIIGNPIPGRAKIDVFPGATGAKRGPAGRSQKQLRRAGEDPSVLNVLPPNR